MNNSDYSFSNAQQVANYTPGCIDYSSSVSTARQGSHPFPLHFTEPEAPGLERRAGGQLPQVLHRQRSNHTGILLGFL